MPSSAPFPPAALPLEPRDESELLSRARALAGLPVAELARRAAFAVDGDGVRTKGKVGVLLERVLGARGGSLAECDFPHLGVEMKTLPLDARGVPVESTYVCTVRLLDADRAEWVDSWARAKLARVLWVPIERASGTVGDAFLWSPSPEQDSILRDDFDEIVGRIGAGGIEAVTGHVGRFMQLRPKAASGRVRTSAPRADGGTLSTVPRGFYLRPVFTGAIVRDPGAVPLG